MRGLVRIVFLVLLLIVCAFLAIPHAEILESSGNVTTEVGKSFTLSCYFYRRKRVMIITWSKDSNNNIPGSTIVNSDISMSVTRSDLKVSNATLSNGGLYKCAALQYSASHIFSVQIEEAVHFTVNPSDINEWVNNDAYISCQAQGTPPPLHISLYKDSELILSSINSSSSGNVLVGTYRIYPLQHNQAGQYYCLTSNVLQSRGGATVVANSTVMTLNVYFPADFITKPDSITTAVGSSVVINCSVEGNPKPIVLWYNGSSLMTENDRVTILVKNLTDGFTNTSILTIVNIGLYDDTNYRCFAQNNNFQPERKSLFKITVIYPALVSTPYTNIVANTTETISIFCDLFGVPLPNVTWYFTNSMGKQVDIIKSGLSYIIFNSQINTRNFTSNLTLVNITKDSYQGLYTCQGGNGVIDLINISNTSTITLFVQVPPFVKTVRPFLFNRLPSDSVSFSFTITGASPPVNISNKIWRQYKDDTTFVDLTNSRNTRFQFSSDHLTLNITNLQVDDEGLYVFKATNEAGSSQDMYMLNIGAVPTILSPLGHVPVTIGTTKASFLCLSQADPIAITSWYINEQGVFLNEGSNFDGKYYVTSHDNGTSQLTINNITFSDGGEYTCRASNILGSTNSSLILKIKVPPNVTLTPVHLIVNHSNSFQVICTGTGNPPVSLLWYTSNSQEPLQNLTNSLTITTNTIYDLSGLALTRSVLHVIAANKYWEGKIKCQGENNISNLIGTVEYREAFVIVQVPPTLTINGSDNVIVLLNTSLLLSFTIYNASPPVRTNNIKWVFTPTNKPHVIITSTHDSRYKFTDNLLTLTINNVTFDDEGIYQISVFNEAGNDVSKITVIVEAPPTIVPSTAEVLVLKEDNVILNCTAVSKPLHSVQWRGPNGAINGTRFSIAGPNTTTHHYGSLLISDVSLSDAGMYVCTVRNKHGQDNITITLRVQVPPQFILSPQDIVAQNNETVVLTCEVYSFPPSEVLWQKDNKLLQVTPPFYVNNTLNPAGVRVRSSLTLSNLNYSNNGSYSCFAYNNLTSLLSLVSDFAILVVNDPVTITQALITPDIINEGDNVKITCQAQGRPQPNITWNTIQGPGLFDIITTFLYNPSSGVYITTSVLSLSNVSYYDIGLYECLASNNPYDTGAVLATDKHSFKVTVIVFPQLLVKESSHTALLNENIAFTAMLTNLPINMVYWKRQDSLLILDDSNKYISHYNSGSGRIILTINSLNIRDRGNYTLTVLTPAGNISASFSLHVYASPSIYTPSPTTSIQLEGGTSTSFECVTDGFPKPNIIWLFNNTLITDRRFSTSFELIQSYRDGVPTFKSVLQGTNLWEDDNGRYICNVTNDWGSVMLLYKLNVKLVNFCDPNPCLNEATCLNKKSSYLCLCADGWTGINCSQVATKPSPPMFIKEPNTTYVSRGERVILSCIVSGYPQPTIRWYKNDVLIEGAESPYYQIRVLTLDTRGQYYCVAINSLGNKTSNKAYVKIKGLVQYRAEFNFSKEFIDNYVIGDKTFHSVLQREVNSNDDTYKVTEQYLSKIETIIDEVLSRSIHSLEGNISYYGVQILRSENITCLLQPIPVLVTLVSEGGNTNLFLALKAILTNLSSILAERTNLLDPVIIKEQNIFRFDGCPDNATINPSPDNDPNLVFRLNWTETDISQSQTLKCPCGPPDFDIGVRRVATRKCIGDFINGAKWGDPDDSQCSEFSPAGRKLCQLASLTETNEIVNGLSNITSETEQIRSLEVSISTVFMEDLSTNVSGIVNLSGIYFNVVDNLLSVSNESIIDSNEEAQTSRRLLDSFEVVVDQYPASNNATSLTYQQYAVTIQQFNSTTDDIIFSVNHSNNTLFNSDDISFKKFNNPAATITLPSSVLGVVNKDNSTVRLTQAVFRTDFLFLRRKNLLRRNPYLKVGSILISASVGNESVEDLKDWVTITFRKNEALKKDATWVNCSFWVAEADDGYGNWLNDGCIVVNETDDIVDCACNHLTTFCLIMDVAPLPENPPPPLPKGAEEVVMSLSYLGCCVSIVCLIIIVLTYTIEKRLRAAKNSKLLLNLCFGLLGLYIVFIPALYSSSVIPLCIVFSGLLHYFFLVSFLGMASEATVLYLDLVKIFTSGQNTIILKIIIVTWVTPLFVVGFSLAPDYENYITEEFCRPIGWQFWIGYIIPFGFIYAYNWIMFVIIVFSIFKQMHHMTSQTGNKTLEANLKKRLLLLVILSLLFGLGWGIGLFTTNSLPVHWLRFSFQIIFVVLTSFQGLFIFILYGIRLLKVRRVWLKWFYTLSNRQDKAVQVDITLRNNYNKSSSDKTPQKPMYQLGSFKDESTSVELKSCVTSSTSSPPISSPVITPELTSSQTPIPDATVPEDAEHQITEKTAAKILKDTSLQDSLLTNETSTVDQHDEKQELKDSLPDL